MSDTNLLLHLLTRFAWLGNWFFFVLTLVEAVPFFGLLVPGGTLIYIGGVLASQGYLNPWDIVIFSSIGAIIGDFLGYLLGYSSAKWIGNRRMINRKLLHRGERFFKRHGNKSIFLGRFLGPIRGIIPLIAGLAKMKRRSFIWWDIVSATSWALISVFGGYFSGTVIFYVLKKWADYSSLIIAIILLIVLSYWFIKKKKPTIIKKFKTKNFHFLKHFRYNNWFKKIENSYPTITNFSQETNYITKELIMGLIVFLLLVSISLLALSLIIF